MLFIYSILFYSILFYSGQVMAQCGSSSFAFGTVSSAGNTFSVPIVATGLPANIFNIVSTVSFYGDDVKIISATAGTVGSANFDNTGTPTADFYHFNLSGHTFASPVTLFTVQFEIVAGGYACIEFVGSNVFSRVGGGGNCYPSLGADVCRTGPSVTVSGIVEKIPEVIAVRTVDIFAEGLSSLTVDGYDVTNINGQFSITPLTPGGTYDVTASKEGNYNCGVSTADSDALQSHLLEIDTFEYAWQYIAADINDSKSISLVDRIRINELILGIDNNFHSSWVFMRDSEYSALSTLPWDGMGNNLYDKIVPLTNLANTTLEWVGIKIGDVNANGCTGSVMDLMEVETRDRKTIRLATNPVAARDDLLIPIYALQFRNQTTLGLGLQFDTEYLEILDVVSGALTALSGENYTVNLDRTGAVDILWNTSSRQGTSVEPNEPLFFIKARSKQAFANLNRLVSLRYDRLDNKAYAIGTVEDIELEISEGQIIQDNPANPAQHVQVLSSPNPFTQELRLQIVVEEDTPASIELLDLNGTVLKTFSQAFHKGKNEVAFSDLQDLPVGYITYRIVLAHTVQSGKVLKIADR